MDKLKKKKKNILFVILTSIMIGLAFYYLYSILLAPYERTDDAYLGANYISVTSQVSGVVVDVEVSDNQFVNKGDLLFAVDATLANLKVKKRQAELELMGPNVRNAVKKIVEAETLLMQTNEDIREARQKHPSYMHELEQQQIVANQMLDKAKLQLQELGLQNEQVRIGIANFEAANLERKNTKVYAAFDGQISNCSLTKGQYVTAGTNLFALISQSEVWVDANFKETQISLMRIGQEASIKIDMYPHHEFTGEIISISGATGTVFSLLPPQNATGNWVKVTQRIPVRILLKQCPGFIFRIGTSTNVSIKVK